MLQALKLLLPALIPSWNFFDIIAPSPRIQFRVSQNKQETSADWLVFRPRPEHVSFIQMLGRMVWNPFWNESLFMMSCAERLIEYPTWHSEEEILKRIARDLSGENTFPDKQYIQFRLITIMRKGVDLEEALVYESRIAKLREFNKQ